MVDKAILHSRCSRRSTVQKDKQQYFILLYPPGTPHPTFFMPQRQILNAHLNIWESLTKCCQKDNNSNIYNNIIIYFDMSNSTVHCWIWPKLNLIRDFLVVLVTCKNEGDTMQNNKLAASKIYSIPPPAMFRSKHCKFVKIIFSAFSIKFLHAYLQYVCNIPTIH